MSFSYNLLIEGKINQYRHIQKASWNILVFSFFRSFLKLVKEQEFVRKKTRRRDFFIFVSGLFNCFHPTPQAPLFPPAPKTLLFPGLDITHPVSLGDVIHSNYA